MQGVRVPCAENRKPALIEGEASQGSLVSKNLEAFTSSIHPQIHATLSTLQLKERRNSGQLALGGWSEGRGLKQGGGWSEKEQANERIPKFSHLS